MKGGEAAATKGVPLASVIELNLNDNIVKPQVIEVVETSDNKIEEIIGKPLPNTMLLVKDESSSGDFTDRSSVSSLEDLGFATPLRGSAKPSLYEIPISVNDVDLQYLKMDKEIFEKITGKIKERNEKFKDPFTDIEWGRLYKEYISITEGFTGTKGAVKPRSSLDVIDRRSVKSTDDSLDNVTSNNVSDSPGLLKSNDYILIINLFLLLQANSEKSYFQRQEFHVKSKKKVPKQKGGGIFDNIKRAFKYDYQLASGFSQYIEGGFNTISIFTSIEAINYFLKTQMSNTTILAMTILIETIGVRNFLSSLQPIAKVTQNAAESILPLQGARRMNNVISFVSINNETLDKYFNDSKKQVLANVSETIRNQVAKYNSSKYSDPMTQIVPISYEEIKKIIIEFQTTFFGTLTEVNKKLTCPVCAQNFSYFNEETYIRQELDPVDIEAEIAELIRLDPNIIIDETLRDKIKEQLEFYCKLNIFPCKQLIDSSGIEKYNATDESKYLCSNCCLEQLNHTDEIAWPFYLGAPADNIKIGVDKIQELIQYLSPTELNTLYNKKYLEHRLSCIKFNQIKMNIIAKGGKPNIIDDEVNNDKITNPNNDLLQVECPTCEKTRTVGRFFRVFKKEDAELLYLHCNRCGTSFNGCDKQSPYIIDQTQFSSFNENLDICTFIERVKLSKRRQNGRARISMEKYKEIKRKEFLDNTSKQIQDDNKPYEKHCPNCNILIDNEVGCSAMTCAACRHKFCYVCCQSVDQNSHGGHDTNHFLVNMDQPLGGWFGIQCVNVHFYTEYYRQTINGNNFNPTPKEEFKALIHITKKKYDYLVEKYKQLGYNDYEIKQLIIGQSDTWRQMDSVYYNKQNDVCYEQGDLRYDPDVLVRNKMELFLQRCDRGDEEPIVPCNTVNPEDIEIVIDDENSEPPPQQEQAVAEQQEPAVEVPPPPLPAVAVAVAPQPVEVEVEVPQQEAQAQYIDLDIEDENIQNIILEGLIRNNIPNNLIRNNVPNNLQIIWPEQQRNIEDNLELLQRIIAENNQNEIDLQIAIHLGQEQEQIHPQPVEPVEAVEAVEALKKEIQSWFDVYEKAKITHFFIHEDFEGECNIVLVANIDYRAMVVVNDQDNEVDDNNKKIYFAYNLRDYWDTDDFKDETEIPMSVENLNKFVTTFNTDVFKSLKIGMHGLFRDKNYLKFMKKKYNISIYNEQVLLQKLEIQPAQNVGGKNKRSKSIKTFKRKTKKHHKKSKRNNKSKKSSSVDIAQQSDRRSSARTTSKDDLGFAPPSQGSKSPTTNLVGGLQPPDKFGGFAKPSKMNKKAKKSKRKH